MKASNVYTDKNSLPFTFKKNLSGNRGGIEILLLLVCIVGVVAFYSLALAFTSLLLEPEIYNDIVEELDERNRERSEKENKLERLNEELIDLARNEKKLTASNNKAKELIRSTNKVEQRKHEDLIKQYNDLLEQVEKLSYIINKLPEKPNIDLGNEYANELNKLNKKSELLDNKLDFYKNCKEIFESLEKIKKKHENLKFTRKKLESELEELEIKAQYRSTAQNKNPIHIECRANDYNIFPDEKTVSLDKLSSLDYFKEIVKGYDLIAFWIRPSGINSFKKAYSTAKTINIAISYEPIIEGKSLESVIGSLTDEE